MSFEINLTTIISGAINSVINATAVFLAIRYLGKMVDRIEKRKKEDNKDNGKDS